MQDSLLAYAPYPSCSHVMQWDHVTSHVACTRWPPRVRSQFGVHDIAGFATIRQQPVHDFFGAIREDTHCAGPAGSLPDSLANVQSPHVPIEEAIAILARAYPTIHPDTISFRLKRCLALGRMGRESQAGLETRPMKRHKHGTQAIEDTHTLLVSSQGNGHTYCQQMWTAKYAPGSASEVLGNEGQALCLSQWLQVLKK